MAAAALSSESSWRRCEKLSHGCGASAGGESRVPSAAEMIRRRSSGPAGGGRSWQHQRNLAAAAWYGEKQSSVSIMQLENVWQRKRKAKAKNVGGLESESGGSEIWRKMAAENSLRRRRKRRRNEIEKSMSNESIEESVVVMKFQWRSYSAKIWRNVGVAKLSSPEAISAILKKA